MGRESQPKTKFTKEQEAQAEIDVWKYVFGFTDMAIVKCAIEMGIPDVLESHDGPVTLEDLSSLLSCHPSLLHRIMRFLAHRGIFKEGVTTGEEGHICYTQTPMSRLLRRRGEKSLAAFILLESSPPMLAPWHELSSRVMIKGSSPFEGAHGEDVWTYAANNPTHSKLINDAMSSHARISVPVIIEHCPEVFEGVNSLVDVGGGDGTTLKMLVKAFPWIHGINFDLPHVISTTTNCDGLENVGGDMFVSIPKADAMYIMGKQPLDWDPNDDPIELEFEKEFDMVDPKSIPTAAVEPAQDATLASPVPQMGTPVLTQPTLQQCSSSGKPPKKTKKKTRRT